MMEEQKLVKNRNRLKEISLQFLKKDTDVIAIYFGGSISKGY